MLDPDDRGDAGNGWHHEPGSDAVRRNGSRPRTVLVLGGGGIKCVAHTGVLRALSRLGITVDECVGTSIGAVVGAAYAKGYGVAEIEQLTSHIAAPDGLGGTTLYELVHGQGHAARARGERHRALLGEWLPESELGALRLPFFCSALSLATGAMQYFGLSGSAPVAAADAVYASSALPGVVEPLALHDELYVDGGIAESLPLRMAEARQPDLIIAVDLSAVDRDTRAPRPSSLPQLVHRLYEILANVVDEHVLHRYGSRGRLVLIQPPVADVGLLGGGDLAAAVERSEHEACRTLATHPLTRYLCDPDLVKHIDRTTAAPRDHARLEVDTGVCINCGLCAETCATGGYAAVPFGNVVRKLHHYECTRDGACVRHCPTGAIRLG